MAPQLPTTRLAYLADRGWGDIMALTVRAREVVQQAQALQLPGRGPGIMAIWLGMQRIGDFAVGIRFTQ